MDKLGILNRITPRKGLRIVNYHWTPQEQETTLSSHFEYFETNHTSLNQEQLIAYLNGDFQPVKPPVVITFDDGFRNNKTVAVPLLDQYNLTGWFFVIGNAGDADGKILEGNLNTRFCMNWQDLLEIQSKGHVIGSHTLNHANLGKTFGDELKHELEASRKLLESKLNGPINTFAYPYGTKNSYHREAIQSVTKHYDLAVHSFPSTIQPGHPQHSLGRMCVESNWDLALLRLRISGCYDGRYFSARNKFMADLEAITKQGQL